MKRPPDPALPRTRPSRCGCKRNPSSAGSPAVAGLGRQAALPTSADLPVSVDDGATRHLAGAALPSVALPSTSGGLVRLDAAAVSLAVVYCYPRTGRPDALPWAARRVGTRYRAPAVAPRSLAPIATIIGTCRSLARSFTA